MQGTVVTDIANMRIEIDQTRFLVLNAANAVCSPLFGPNLSDALIDGRW
jgi:hypothetical protein